MTGFMIFCNLQLDFLKLFQPLRVTLLYKVDLLISLEKKPGFKSNSIIKLARSLNQGKYMKTPKARKSMKLLV